MSFAKDAKSDKNTGPAEDQAVAVAGTDGPSKSVDPAATTAQIRWLQGRDFVYTQIRSPEKRRLLGGVALLVMVLLVITPFGAWIRYQSVHVTSTNALVRGHLGEIGTQLDGVVKAVEVDAGDRVVIGQPLVRLDDRQLRAEALETRATVEGLERELEVERMAIEHERRRIDQQMQESAANVRAADEQSNAAKIRAEDARRNFEVRRELFSGGGAVSGEDVRDAETNQLTAEALFRASEAEKAAAIAAQDEARLAGDALAIRERRIGVLEAELLRAQARLSKAEADLEDAVIRAPENGAIVRRIVQAGSSVEIGQPIISMWLGDEVWIEAWIDEDDISQVLPGSQATVTFHSIPDMEFTGHVDKIGLTTDFEVPETEVPQPRASRMRSAPVVAVRVRLDETPANLLPGLSAVVAIRKQDE